MFIHLISNLFVYTKTPLSMDYMLREMDRYFISILFNQFNRASDFDTTLHLTLFTLRHKDKCHTHSISHLKRRSCLYIPLSNRVRERMMISLLWCNIFDPLSMRFISPKYLSINFSQT